MDRFKDKTAMITGAAGSLGAATARMLAAEGARLLLFDKDEAALSAVAAECVGALVHAGDVTKATDLEEAAGRLKREYGRIDLLAAAAGVLGPTGKLVSIDEEDWDRLFAINVKGAWLTTRAVIPHMLEAGKGSIVLFSSTAGLVGSPTLSSYSVSKGAVTLMGRSLALNHAEDNIRVNCVCPGTIDSRMADETIAKTSEDGDPRLRRAVLEALHPMKRLGTPDEVAAAVLYFLGDQAGFTTGVALPVDGGRLA